MIRTSITILLLWWAGLYCLLAQESIWGGLDTFVKFEIMEIGRDDGILHSANLFSIVEDSSGVLYLGTWEGLYRYNGYHSQRLFEHFQFEQDKLFASLSCYFIIDDHRGHLWFFTDEGVYSMTKKSYEIKLVFKGKDNPDNWQHRFEMVTELDDRLYAGSRNGMHVFDLENQSYIKSYFVDQGFFENSDPMGWSDLAQPHPHPDSIWIGCLDGMRATHVENEGYRVSKADLAHGAHHFYFGNYRKDSLLICGLYDNGIAYFNLQTGNFEVIPTEDYLRTGRKSLNRITSLIPLNDSILLIHGEQQHCGLFHLNRRKIKWISAFPQEFRSGFVFNADAQGYIWTAWWGRLHRSTRPLIEKHVPLRPILDISEVWSNGQVISEPYINEFEPIELLDYQRSVSVVFSMTRPDLYDSLRYQYQINNGQIIEHASDENVINIPTLKAGLNRIRILALQADDILVERTLILNRFVPFYQRKFFYPLLSALFAVFVVIFYFYQMRIVKQRERIKKEYEVKLARVEGEALRSQINPHFIFNTLNSIKLYSLKKSPQEAGAFITKFSNLIRSILENSRHNLIALSQEIDTLVRYIEIENIRFRNSFEFELSIDDRIDTEFFKIPPMVLQPFIENAIWHGLLHKEGDGRLILRFQYRSDEHIVCEIEDNGIGRKRSKIMRSAKLNKNSLGLKITKERLDQLNQAEGMNNSFEVIDLQDGTGRATGTLVRVNFTYE